MIINGKELASQVISALQAERSTFPPVLRLGVLMGESDVASQSFVKIKERVADKLQVVVVREEVNSTEQALRALERLVKNCAGVIVQLPLPQGVDTEQVISALPANKDVDGVTANPIVRAPVAEAVLHILQGSTLKDKKAVVVGQGRLVGAPAAKLLEECGAEVTVVTQSKGSLDDLKTADIVVLGAGEPGLVKPHLLKQGVILIDAGTSEAAGKLAGDADPACAEVASIFTPVPGGVGPLAVAMIFKNLFALAK